MLPLQPEDAARLFKDIALEALPHELRPLSVLTAHPVLQALDGLPGAIWQTARNTVKLPALAVPQLGSCASSARAWRL